MVGVPTLAGSEDGPSTLREHYGVSEGRRRCNPRGCHGYKVAALELPARVLLGRYEEATDPGGMPHLAPLQVIVLYDTRTPVEAPPLAAFATVPGEPTTAVGDDIVRRLGFKLAGSETALDPGRVFLTGLANGYLGYLTTPAEYAAQHYEGGSTFWGPLAGLFTAERLESVAARARDEMWRRRGKWPNAAPREVSARVLHEWRTVSKTGPRVSFFGARTDCAEHARSWTAPDVFREPQAGAARRVVFRWSGLDDDHWCSPPALAVLCGAEPLLAPDGTPETDDGTRFDVRRESDERWRAVFFPRPAHAGRRRCRLRIDRAEAEPLWSPEFSL
jgi:hypothetical protein